MDEVESKKIVIIPLRDIRYTRLAEPEQVYGFSFDDEPVVMLFEAA